MESPCAHVDFYPNGGSDQPGCSLFDMPVSLDTMVAPDSNMAMDMGRHLVACSHNRGIDLYIESLRSTTCTLIGHECPSFEAFEQGLCFDCGANGERCIEMGHYAENYKDAIRLSGKRHIKYFLKTGGKSPFCRKYNIETCSF